MTLGEIVERLRLLASELPPGQQKTFAQALVRELSTVHVALGSRADAMTSEAETFAGEDDLIPLRGLIDGLQHLLRDPLPDGEGAGDEKLFFSWRELEAMRHGGEVHPKLQDWALEAFADASAHIGGSAFPCIFGRRAVLTRAGWTCFVDTVTEDAERDKVRRAILQYFRHIDGLPERVAALQPFQVLVKPVEPVLSAHEYGEQAWGLFQYLHDHDEEPWPAEVPTDTESGSWSFCFAGREFFSNVSHPAHVVALGRNVGRCLQFAMQPRKNFDLVAPTDQAWGRHVRKRIVDRVAELEGGEIAPELVGYHGSEEARQWMQFVRPEGDEPYWDRCPLHIRRKDES